MTDPIDRLTELFESEGVTAYLGELVTVEEHLLQTAALACAGGHPTALVVSALLHDVGHLNAVVGANGDDAEVRHGELGARWLAQWFSPEVTEPIRLHVAAKRYLSATEPRYRSNLSPASEESLLRQGGVLPLIAAAEFAALPFASAAVALRRLDDEAKVPGLATPSFDDFVPLIESLLG